VPFLFCWASSALPDSSQSRGGRYTVCEGGFELSQGFRHVAAAITEADVAWLVVHVARQQKDTEVFDQRFAQGEDVATRKILDKADGTGVGWSPLKKLWMTSEESGKQREIVQNDLAIAFDELFAVAQGEFGKKFAGRAAADGRVVLELITLVKDFWSTASEPSEPKTWQAVGLAHGAEADRAFIEVAGSWKTPGGIVFEFAIDFIGKNVDAGTRSELQDPLQDGQRHKQASWVVRRVDIDGAGVGADQRFKGCEIVRPIVFGFAAPLAYLCAGAPGNGECAFVTRGFYDDVI